MEGDGGTCSPAATGGGRGVGPEVGGLALGAGDGNSGGTAGGGLVASGRGVPRLGGGRSGSGGARVRSAEPSAWPAPSEGAGWAWTESPGDASEAAPDSTAGAAPGAGLESGSSTAASSGLRSPAGPRPWARQSQAPSCDAAQSRPTSPSTGGARGNPRVRVTRDKGRVRMDGRTLGDSDSRPRGSQDAGQLGRGRGSAPSRGPSGRTRAKL